MSRRLVLGCGPVGEAVVRSAAGWPGELSVVDADADRVESLRERNVAAVAGDPTDPDTYPDSADVVFVAGGEAATNRAAAEAARGAFPDARLVVHLADADTPTAEAIRAVADDVLDPLSALTDHVTGLTTGPGAARTRRLLRVLRTADPPLAVLTHDNPDPDAIASAIGLCRLAGTVGLEAEACYFGTISHQENRALVNVLGLDLRNLDDPGDVEEYGAVALVDHSRPGVNDQLPPDTAVDVVIDHHPPRAPVEAGFVDLRPTAGATSTLVTEHFGRLDRTPEEHIATALLYGIHVDTGGFTREVSGSDFEAAAALLPAVDQGVLEQVESPSVTAEVLDVIARAIRDRAVEGAALSACVGGVGDRDALAQAAERLLAMEGISVTLVYGFMDGTVYASARARGAAVDVGETLRDAFDRIGSAGGHADMAGAQIPLGILAGSEETDAGALTRVVREVIDDRFFDALGDAPGVPSAAAGVAYESAGAGERAAARPESERAELAGEDPDDGES